MFVRKLVVMVVPLLLAALLCWIFPLLEGLGFWRNVLTGLGIGVSLALLLPLSGASKRKEPFAGLLWVPLLVLFLVVLGQTLAVNGVDAPVLSLVETSRPEVVLVECAFIGFMSVQAIRTKK